MALDPHVQRFLRALATGKRSAAHASSVSERRAGLAQLLALGAVDFPVARARDVSLPGPGGALGARLYEPADPPSAPGAVILYLHGGGCVAGSIDTHASISRALCHFSRCHLLALEYRLAPEWRFPAALADARAALEYLAHSGDVLGIDPARIVLCGDSAGGTLAAATAQAAARAGSPRIALQVLICPILDYSRRSASRCEHAQGYLLDEATLAHDLEHYLPADVRPEDPRVSPLRAESLAGGPRTLLHTAEFDPLRDEGLEYFKRLQRDGAALSYTCHAGMIHLFYGLGAVVPHARVALEQIGHEIRTGLDAA